MISKGLLPISIISAMEKGRYNNIFGFCIKLFSFGRGFDSDSAGWTVGKAGVIAKAFGRNTGFFFENLGEIALIFETAKTGNIYQRDGVIQQELLAFFDPDVVDVRKQTVAGFILEKLAQVRTAERNIHGYVIQCDFSVEVLLDVIDAFVNDVTVLDVGVIEGVVDEIMEYPG